jgi:hypothetical protein
VRVVGCGPTRRAAFHAVRDLIAKYPRHAVRFTGVCTEPLIRPSLVIDDETLELLRSVRRRDALHTGADDVGRLELQVA